MAFAYRSTATVRTSPQRAPAEVRSDRAGVVTLGMHEAAILLAHTAWTPYIVRRRIN
jgi:hypothetical protein